MSEFVDSKSDGRTVDGVPWAKLSRVARVGEDGSEPVRPWAA